MISNVHDWREFKTWKKRDLKNQIIKAKITLPLNWYKITEKYFNFHLPRLSTFRNWIKCKAGSFFMK